MPVAPGIATRTSDSPDGEVPTARTPAYPPVWPPT